MGGRSPKLIGLGGVVYEGSVPLSERSLGAFGVGQPQLRVGDAFRHAVVCHSANSLLCSLLLNLTCSETSLRHHEVGKYGKRAALTTQRRGYPQVS